MLDKLFLSAGAMKAGTTWTYDLLSRHPGVWSAVEKELHYLAHAYGSQPGPLTDRHRLSRVRAIAGRIDPEKSSPAAVRRRLVALAAYLDDPADNGWYSAQFAGRPANSWAADFSNLTALLDGDGWRKARSVARDMRVLYTLRHPIERAWSNLKFELAQSGRLGTLADADPAALAKNVRGGPLWQQSEYGTRVRAMRSALEPHELMLACYEDIGRDPLGWLRRVEVFLGLDPADYPAERLNRRVNEGPADPVPPAFAAVLEQDHQRVIDELADIGFSAPDSWQ